jgi:hypothetical protein
MLNLDTQLQSSEKSRSIQIIRVQTLESKLQSLHPHCDRVVVGMIQCVSDMGKTNGAGQAPEMVQVLGHNPRLGMVGNL